MSFPIVLAHGIARFDILRAKMEGTFNGTALQLDDSWHYFRGIKSCLKANGFDAHHASVSFAGSVQTRARGLAAQIDSVLCETKQSKVHLIAHSMGGLDARHMIVDLPGYADKVASLTTIGTPHLGTTWADVALEYGGELLVEKTREYFDLTGFRDLTTHACAEFNRRAEPLEANNEVAYHTWSSFSGFGSVFWILQASWLYLQGKEGANDGLVSVRSQAWTNRLSWPGKDKSVTHHNFPFEADHLNQIGWWDPSKWSVRDNLAELPKRITEFEDGIKAVYLEMARDADRPGDTASKAKDPQAS